MITWLLLDCSVGHVAFDKVDEFHSAGETAFALAVDLRDESLQEELSLRGIQISGQHAKLKRCILLQIKSQGFAEPTLGIHFELIQNLALVGRAFLDGLLDVEGRRMLSLVGLGARTAIEHEEETTLNALEFEEILHFELLFFLV